MTSPAPAESPARPQTPDGAPENRTIGQIAASIAATIAMMPQYNRGGFASLKRMHPEQSYSSECWKLLARQGLLGQPDRERTWAFIIHGIALMTRTTGPAELEFRSAHNSNFPVGAALYAGNHPPSGRPVYAERRLLTLLSSDGPSFHSCLERMFRHLASKGVTLDWREMARYIIAHETNSPNRHALRDRILRDYYNTERDATTPTRETSNS